MKNYPSPYGMTIAAPGFRSGMKSGILNCGMQKGVYEKFMKGDD